MTRRVLVVRGGATSAASGLGRIHQQLVDRLIRGDINGYTLETVSEYPPPKSLQKRFFQRHMSHPKRVKKATIQKGIDIIHVTDQEQAHLIPRNSSVPVTLTVHDLFQFEAGGVLATKDESEIKSGDGDIGLIRKWDLKQLLKGLARADLLISISEYTAQKVREYFPNKKLVVVPHGLDPNVLDFIPLNQPEFMEDTEKCHLLYVGSEAPRKRLGWLIEVIGMLPQEEREKVVLHKLGAESDADLARQLKQLSIAKSVNMNWVGRVSDSELRAAYQHAELLLFPSAEEGFGLPPLEAMAEGCPVLAANAPAHNEVVREEMLLGLEDESEWVEAISQVVSGWIERKGEKRNPSESALKRAGEYNHLVWSKRMADAWDSLFE